MKRIHVLQHMEFETPGCIMDWIKSKSYCCTVTELYADCEYPEISEIDWLIIMGGSMSVHDYEDFPWLAGEKKFIADAVRAGKIIIGICLGSQLIAEVLGSRVYKNIVKEIGWFPVKVFRSGYSSKLFKSFSDTETVFHWHGDTFDMPDGAHHLFTSEACINQCFIYNERVIGLQFHIEVTEELLEDMIAEGTGEIVSSQYIQNEAQLKAGASNIKRNNELMYSLLDELDNTVII